MSPYKLNVVLLLISLFLFHHEADTQTITVSPSAPTINDAVTVIYDLTQGDAGLVNCNCDIYVHTGLITLASANPKDWKHIVTQWGVANPDWKMTPVNGEPNKYSFTISPSIREYYGLNPEEGALQLAFVFRNDVGSIAGFEADGADIYYNLADAAGFNPEADSLELVRFYQATDGSNWQTPWDLEMPMSTWPGVILNNFGLVSELNLGNNLLFGSLIDLQLPALKTLFLSSNDLFGSLPDFSGLPSLDYLAIRDNSLSGPIPDFSGLPILTVIDLEENNLDGNIPDFSNLPALDQIYFRGNKLEGPIPDFSNLPNLGILHIDNNQLSGNIPDFSNLPSLDLLGLERNNLTGSIPDFSNLPDLDILALSLNQIGGSIPDFTNLPDLATVEANNCRLEGSIPDFSSLPKLKNLLLENNDLSGPIPDFSNTPLLTDLFLTGNNLSGNIPNFSGLPELQKLFIAGNNLEGLIPDFSNCSKLIDFIASSNRLSGPIPDFSNLPNLSRMIFDENKLTGPLPDFTDLEKLKTLVLRGNNIGDSIPNFANLPNLETLDLHDNDFEYAPAMTNLPFLNLFSVELNELTFDDVKRNIGLTNFFGELVDYRYAAQAPIPAVCDTIWAAIGSNLAFRLYFDETLTDNVYEWFRNGAHYLTTQGQNRLNIYDLQAEDTGNYSWRVTNPTVPDLVLDVEPVFLQVDEINQDSLNHLRLSIPDVYGTLGETICFDVQAEPFDSLSSLDLSMKWDPTILGFSGVQEFNLTDLDAGDFGINTVLTDKGRLTLSWSSVTNLGNGGESATESISLFKTCFEAKADTCRNGLLEFTNDPLPLQVSNAQDSCVFFDGRPGTFISSCDQEFRIPEESMYLAQTEYTDTLGWTNYIKKREVSNLADTLLLSIKKNNREIGNVQDGRFHIEVQKRPNTIDVTSQVRQFPGYGQIDQAIALDYWWYVQPNYTFVNADTTFGLGFYFEPEDLDRLSEAVGAEVRLNDLFFYKISNQNEENACLELATAFDPGLARIYDKGDKPSTSQWVLETYGENSLVGAMDLDGFSCGGIMAIIQSVKTKEIKEITHFTLAPNPAEDRISLSIQTQKAAKYSLKIFNSLGKLVFTDRLNTIAGKNQKELSVNFLPQGFYFLDLQNEHGENLMYKFAINR